MVGGAPGVAERAPPGEAGPSGFQDGGHGSSGTIGDRVSPPSVRPGLTGPPPISGPQRDTAVDPIVAADPPDVGSDGEVFDTEESMPDGEASDELPSFPSASVMLPEPEMVARWESFQPFSATTSSTSAARRRMKKWMGGESSVFSPPRQEPFLFSLYNSFKKSSKSSWDAAASLMSSSGAAGHAIVHAASKLDAWKSYLEKSAKSQEEKDADAPWIKGFEELMGILDDAASILASSFSRGVAEVRKGVLSAAQPELKPILSAQPPADGFFFGNPQQQIQGAAQFHIMSAQLAQATRAAASRPFPRRPPLPPRSAAPSQARAAPATSATSSSSSSGKGKGYGRSSRGGKGGQKKN